MFAQNNVDIDTLYVIFKRTLFRCYHLHLCVYFINGFANYHCNIMQ